MTPLRHRRPGELVFTIVLLAGSLFMLWQAYGISKFESITSAGVFPMLAALTLVVTGLLVLRDTLRARLAPDPSGRSPAQRFALELTPAVVLSLHASPSRCTWGCCRGWDSSLRRIFSWWPGCGCWAAAAGG